MTTSSSNGATAGATTGLGGVTLHTLKKIEIIVPGEQSAFVQDLLLQAQVTGYTVIRDISGYGHQGFHEGRLLFNDTHSLVMVLAVAPEAVIARVIAGLRPLLEKQSGVMFLSDTQVVRAERFAPAQGAPA